LFFEVCLIETPSLAVIRLYPQHSSGRIKLLTGERFFWFRLWPII
jgi:hypothetical protein